MKRVITVFGLFAVMMLAVGCSRNEAQSGGFSKEDLSLTVEGTSYRADVDILEVIEHLGEDYGYAEGMSCDYDGLDKTYDYGVASFYTNPLAAGDMVFEIYTLDERVTTSKGIAVGASREEVLAAYGDDCEDEGDLLIYRVEGERSALYFELDGGVVWAIYLSTLQM